MTSPNPEPEPKPEPAPTDPPQQHAEHTHEELSNRVGGLESRVEELTALVNAVVSVKPDSSPVGKPWTHRRLMK